MSFDKKSNQVQQAYISEIFAETNVSELHVFYTNKSEYSDYICSLFFDHLKPLLQPLESWFTVGDYHGADARWLSSYCKDALATDIGDTFLIWAQQEGYIQSFSRQNAEKLTLEDDSFDFAFCKEAFHHFPRPYLAVYEMLRCARKGIVFSEPVDPYMKMPFLLFLCNILDTKKNPKRSAGFWKNRFSFEAVGNYVYKISQREFEKIAMGIGLPAVAFYYYNIPLGIPTIEKFRKKRAFLNFLAKLRIIPYQRLTAVLFKELPDEDTKKALCKQGYYYYELPKNPYI
jgi:SAM-dependent methyltransferase